MLLSKYLYRLLLSEEIDQDKAILALNGIKGILSQCINSFSKGNQRIEISANTSHFLGRIGGYSGSMNLLKSLGFNLETKNFSGLVLLLRAGPQIIADINKCYTNLCEFLEIFKLSRISNQFVADYEL